MMGIIYIAAAYLLGSLPHLRLMGLMYGKRLQGDLHMELYQQCGRLVGTTGILIDVAKGVLVVVIGKSLRLDTNLVVLGGLATVVGQMWPIFSHFDGEKGNSTAIGLALTLTAVPFVIAVIPMFVGMLMRTVPHLTQRNLSLNEKLKFVGPPSLSLPLGMAIGFAILPLAAWWHGESRSIVLGYIALFVLIMIRRATASLGSELKGGGSPLNQLLINRLLYDRSTL